MNVELPGQNPMQEHAEKQVACEENISIVGSVDWVTLSNLYENLKWSARNELVRFADELSIGPTDLVHLAFVEVAEKEQMKQSDSRAYVFSVTVTKMHDILIRRARERRTLKRGGHLKRVPLDAVVDYFEDQKVDVSDLQEALRIFEAQDPDLAKRLVMRYILGMSVPEIAKVEGVSESTIEKDLQIARARLKRELERMENPAIDNRSA